MPAAQLVDLAKTRGRKPILYSLVSVIAVITGQSVLIFCSAVLHWGAVTSNVVSVAIGSIPSYALNRSWVWGKKGKSHLWKEVVPFWALGLLGLLLSTVTVAVATSWKDETWVLSLANLAAFGVIWIGKFFILHYVLFTHDEVTTDGDQPGVVIPG